MDPALWQYSHDVDASNHRRVLHRERRRSARSSRTGETMVHRSSQTTLPKCVGDSTRRHENRSGPTNLLFAVPPSGEKRFTAPWLKPMLRANGRSKRIDRRRGQALLEFAILIPIIIILIGATISFGLFFFQANVLQQAVDVAAQEIARMPFEPEQELGLGDFNVCGMPDLASDETTFKEKIYDEQYLVINDSEWLGTDFQSFVDTLPLLNRLLVPAMIRDNDMTRYPGALVVNSNTGEQTVLIPIVEYREVANSTSPTSFPETIRASGETIVQWVAPVEEIRADHDNDPSTPNRGPFALLSSTPALSSFEPGMVALRINYPAQSTTLLNRDLENVATNPDGRRRGIIVLAGDVEINASNDFSSCYTLDTPSARISPGSLLPGSNPNAGEFGLGELEALTRVVRPFRRVMSFQAIYRREVFR